MAGYIHALRSALAQLLGENDRTVTIVMPGGLPSALQPVVADTVERLTVYQNRAYAQLYLDRLGRFTRRREVGGELLAEIAALLAERMMYDDPIRIAQLTLLDAAIGPDGKPARRVHTKCRFRLDELVSALPEVVADPALDVIGWLGWQHMPLTIRFSARSWLGVRRLRAEAWLRRWRLLSIRYAKERAWVERWLHMVDRALSRQPQAAAAVVRSAAMIRGHGDAYRYGMADWTLIIDALVKPSLNGTLPLPDLPAAIAEARAAALPERKQIALKRAVAAIRARVGGEAPPLPAKL